MASADDWAVAFTEGDPLHEELQRYLRAVRKRGRYSPVPRVLARWAANGYLIDVGRLPTGGTTDAAAIFDALAATGLLAATATPEAVADALGALADAAQRPRRPRLDLAEAQREIAAIEASADGMHFE